MTAARPDWERFFDDLAERWDTIARHDPSVLEELLTSVALQAGERVLDVGTGTGILIPWILRAVGESGTLVACDLSSRMLEKARLKHPSGVVRFVHSSVEGLARTEKDPFDAILCYSVLPHFADPIRTLTLLASCLARGGRLAVFHSQSREAINALHRETGGPVCRDHLPPAKEIATHLVSLGLDIPAVHDHDRSWLVIGRRPLV